MSYCYEHGSSRLGRCPVGAKSTNEALVESHDRSNKQDRGERRLLTGGRFWPSAEVFPGANRTAVNPRKLTVAPMFPRRDCWSSGLLCIAAGRVVRGIISANDPIPPVAGNSKKPVWRAEMLPKMSLAFLLFSVGVSHAQDFLPAYARGTPMDAYLPPPPLLIQGNPPTESDVEALEAVVDQYYEAWWAEDPEGSSQRSGLTRIGRTLSGW